MPPNKNTDFELSIDHFLAQLSAASSEKERSWLSLQFNLANHSANVRAAVFAASVPHWFDMKMLHFLLDFELSPSEEQVFLSLPYIERYDTSFWNVHEKTRSLLRQHLKKHNAAIFARFSRKAAAWARKNKLKSYSWIVEGVYHSVLAEENGAENLAIDTGIDLLNSRRHAQLEAFTRHILAAADDGLIYGKLIAWCWFFICSMDLMNERLDEAESAAMQIRKLCNGDSRLLAESDLLTGLVRMRQGHPRQASVLFKSAADSFKECKQHVGRANAIANLGVAESHMANLKSAANHYAAAKKIFIEFKESQGQAMCECRQGEIAAYRGDYSLAEQHFRVALSLFKKSSNKQGIANCLVDIGRVYSEQTKFQQAENQYVEGLSLYEALNTDLGRLNTFRELGELYSAKRDFVKAESLIEHALRLARDMGDGLSEANCLRALGANGLAAGFIGDKVYRSCTEAHKLYVSRGYLFGELVCALDVAHIDEECGRFEAALEQYLNILSVTESSDVPTIKAMALAQLARYHFNRMELGRARTLVDLALDTHINMHGLLLSADIKITLRDFAGAERALQSAASINANFSTLIYLQAKLALWQGELQESRKKFELCNSESHKTSDILLWMAVLLEKLGEEFESELKQGLNVLCRLSDLQRFVNQVKVYNVVGISTGLDKILKCTEKELENRSEIIKS